MKKNHFISLKSPGGHFRYWVDYEYRCEKSCCCEGFCEVCLLAYEVARGTGKLPLILVEEKGAVFKIA
ncbi:hypothetical protein [Acerihabitans arboris]|nr:hypothetical protein [Acerihabitans arboris]